MSARGSILPALLHSAQRISWRKASLKAIFARWLTAAVAGVVVGVILATSVGAPAVPAAGRAASIARCDIRPHKPFREAVRIIYASQVRCNGSVTLDDVVIKLQKQRSAGGWRVIDKANFGPFEVRHRHRFSTYRFCRRTLSGTFRSIGIITKGSNSEKDVSAEERIHCTSPYRS